MAMFLIGMITAKIQWKDFSYAARFYAYGTTAVLASKYGSDAEFAASVVAVSTALSLIAIPVWEMLL